MYFLLVKFQLHQENRKKGKKREKSVDEEDEEVKREKLNKVWYFIFMYKFSQA